MFGLAYWTSSTGNTGKFVGRLGWPAVRIENASDPIQMTEPYVLIHPTFADGEGRGSVPKPVIRFLNVEANRLLLRGVIGGGNRNFGDLFAIGAKVTAAKCDVPLLYRFELAGDDADVRRVQEGLERLWQAQTLPAPMIGT